MPFTRFIGPAVRPILPDDGFCDANTRLALDSSITRSANTFTPSTMAPALPGAAKATAATPVTPSRPTLQRTLSMRGPPSKRARVAPLATVCDFGPLPAAHGNRTYTALLVPFIHAVVVKVSTLTNEVPQDAPTFQFGFTTFPIRARHPAEFDAVVDGYARVYVAQGIGRSFVYKQFCDKSTGNIVNDDQERLTDPSHRTTLIPTLPAALHTRLAALAR